MNSSSAPLRFSVVTGSFAVTRFPADHPAPTGPARSSFWSVTRTVDELSIVSSADDTPPDGRTEDGWGLLRLEGPFPFSQVGVLVSVLKPLAQAGIGIFAVSTFDTDYILVKTDRFAEAIQALENAGHIRIEA